MAAGTPIAFSANDVIIGALELLGVYVSGESPSAADAQTAFRRLNRMVSGWSILPLTFPFISREVFATVANQGTYTIGPGGDWDTIRPTSLDALGCLLPATGSGVAQVEIPIGLITDDAYEAIQIKDQTTGGSGQWSVGYFNPEYLGGLASLFLWPTPSTATNSAVIYRGDQVQQFPNLTSALDFPPGYADALEYGLAERLIAVFAVSDPTIIMDIKQGAQRYLSQIKVANFKPSDLGFDTALTSNRRGGYNIQTGNY